MVNNRYLVSLCFLAVLATFGFGLGNLAGLVLYSTPKKALHMPDDNNLTQEVRNDYGNIKHRSVKINRCANGYIVEYALLNPEYDENSNRYQQQVLHETRVFLTNTDLMEWLAGYFPDEPRP